MIDQWRMNGYDNRQAYLNHLAEVHQVDIQDVEALADHFGEGEDFDGLVNAVEDCQQ